LSAAAPSPFFFFPFFPPPPRVRRPESRNIGFFSFPLLFFSGRGGRPHPSLTTKDSRPSPPFFSLAPTMALSEIKVAAAAVSFPFFFFFSFPPFFFFLYVVSFFCCFPTPSSKEEGDFSLFLLSLPFSFRCRTE